MPLDKLKKVIAEKQFYTYNIDCSVSSMISVFDLSYEIDASKLVKEIYEFKKQYPQSMHEYNSENTNVRAWHSDFGTNKLTKILDPLIEIQNKKVKNFLSPDEVCSIRNIWINIYESGNFVYRHKHTEFGGLSTVYFPYVEDDCTPIIFDNNNPIKMNKIEIFPKTNMLIIFPSYMYHFVPTVKEKSRISISSNLNLIKLSDAPTENFIKNFMKAENESE